MVQQPVGWSGTEQHGQVALHGNAPARQCDWAWHGYHEKVALRSLLALCGPLRLL